MPLVLTQNEVTESGHAYADILGVQYEYPTRYARLIRPGVGFVYYRGRRRASGAIGPQQYIGVGVIGRVRAGAAKGRLICSIAAYRPFVRPVYFKQKGRYLESGAADFGSQAGLYLRQGVRAISSEEFDEILSAAGLG